ncbi:Os06g0595180, partial [Oryza sativa Japonica Group]
CRQRRRWCQRAHPPKSIPTVVPMESLTVRSAIEVEAPGPGARRRPSSILAFGHDGMHVAMPALGRRRGISSPSRHDF